MVLDKFLGLIVYNRDMGTLIQAITDCGDLAILLPVACVLTVWAALIRDKTVFTWWLIALALCVGGTGILKIYFFACPPLSDLHSPSGHTSFSTLVYGTLTLAVASAVEGWRRWISVLIGTLFILAIAVSRIVVHAHSVPEVILGSILGVIALSLLVNAYRREKPTKTYLAPLVTVCAMLVVLLNGHEVRAEELLHHIAVYLNIASECRV
jgi:membrane-associated phospholipid phosphatase